MNVCRFEFTKANSDKDGNDRANSDKLCEQLQWSMIQQLSCTYQRQRSQYCWVTHLQFFGIHKTKWKAKKWKVSKEEVTQSHEHSELRVRNNFTTQKVYIKQRNSVRQSTKQVACINRVMTVTTLLRSMSKEGRFHINSRLLIWCYNEDMKVSTTTITCENKWGLSFLMFLKSFTRCHFVFNTSTQIFYNTSEVFSKNVPQVSQIFCALTAS